MSNYEYMLNKLLSAESKARNMEHFETEKQIRDYIRTLHRIEGDDNKVAKFYYATFLPLREDLWLYF